MRMRFVFGAVSVGAVAVAGVVAACGGETETADTTSADAGNDAAIEAAALDAAADAGKDSGPPCDTSGDLTDTIPDAALGGVSTTGACSQCLKRECGSVIDSCNKDCNCRAFVGEVLACVTKGGKTIEQCALSTKVTPTAKTFQIAQPLQGCLQTDCNDDCAVDELMDAGPDAM